MALIFSTIHGSRLYGLEREGSDYDYYSVCTNDHEVRPQRIRSFSDRTEDIVEVTLDKFLKDIENGGHQAIEALMSLQSWGVGINGKVQVGPEIERYFDMLFGMRITSPKVFLAYERTIRALAFGDTKRRRQAIRLRWNLSGLRGSGRFDPTLTPGRADTVRRLADDLSGARMLAEFDIPPSSK